MASAWQAVLVLLALLVGLAQEGHAADGSTADEDVTSVCSVAREIFANDDRLRVYCQSKKSEVRIFGKIARKSLAAALTFPHRPPHVDPKGDLLPLSPDLCRIGAEGVEGKDVTSFLDALAARAPSQQPETLQFSNLRVNGPFDAPSAPGKHELLFENVVFCGPVDFSDAEMTRRLQFTKSVFVAGPGETSEGIFRADGLRGTTDVTINDSRAGGIILERANLFWVGITESAFGHVSASGMTAERLVFTNSRQYQSIFNRTHDWLERLPDSHDNQDGGRGYAGIMGTYPLAFFASNIDLWDVKLRGLLYADRLIVDGALAALNAEISTVRLRMAVLPAVDFRRLDANRVELFGAAVGKASNRNDCEIDFAYRYDVDFVSFQGADISSDFLLRPQPTGDGSNDTPQEAVAHGPICLNELHVGGDLDLSAVSAEQIDLRWTTVGATFSLASEKYGTARFSPCDSFLDMRGMQIRVISMSGTLVLPIRLRMAQSSVGGFVFTGNPDANMADASSVERLTTLIKTIASLEERALAFQVFETTLRDAGHSTASLDLSFLREYSVTRNMDYGFRRFTRHVAEVFGGYGTKPVRTAIVTLTATVIGAIFAWHSFEGRWFLMRQVLSDRALRGGSRRFGMQLGRWKRLWRWMRLRQWLIFDTLVLSLDRLIPLVSINRPHKELVFRKQRLVRAYFVLHSILGFLLAGTTISVISKSIGLD